jgi:hypothetical protein
VYSATKAAVNAVTRSLAQELGPRKIRVNAINPGMVETEGVHAAGISESDFRKQVEAQTPLGRIGQPQDMVVRQHLACRRREWATGPKDHDLACRTALALAHTRGLWLRGQFNVGCVARDVIARLIAEGRLPGTTKREARASTCSGDMEDPPAGAWPIVGRLEGKRALDRLHDILTMHRARIRHTTRDLVRPNHIAQAERDSLDRQHTRDFT